MRLHPSRRLLLTVSIITLGACSTTTHGVVGSQVTADWIEEQKSRPCTITFKEALQAMPVEGSLGTPTPTVPRSRSPETRILLVSGTDKQEIPLAMVSTVTVVSPPQGLRDGALIGAAVGILAGLGSSMIQLASKGDMAGKGGEVLSTTVGTTLIGALIGVLIGGGAGHRNILAF